MQMTEEAAPSARADRGIGVLCGCGESSLHPGPVSGRGEGRGQTDAGSTAAGLCEGQEGQATALPGGRVERGPERAGRGPNGPQCLRPAPKLS